MNSLLLKNWKLVLIAICFVLIVGAWQYDHAAQYRRGRESMAAEISGRLKDSAIEKAKQDRESSAICRYRIFKLPLAQEEQTI